MIHAILRQTHIIGDVKSRLYIWNHGADLNSSGDFLSLRDEEFRQPELTSLISCFLEEKEVLPHSCGLATFVWVLSLFLPTLRALPCRLMD